MLFLLRELKGIEIEGCTVLIVSKTDHNYRTYDLDLHNEEHINFLDDCEQTFMTLVAGYKMRLYTLNEYYKTYGIEKWKKK